MKKLRKIGLVLGISSLCVLLNSCDNVNNKGESKNDNNIEAPDSDTSKKYIKVEFELNGHGNSIASMNIEDGSLIPRPNDPTEPGWIFEGWYENSNFTEVFDFNSVISASSLKIYAKWRKAYNKNSTPTIYLAGDSTVQTYSDSLYIGGWGQYLSDYLNDSVKVVN